jgi:hypothetical protein
LWEITYFKEIIRFGYNYIWDVGKKRGHHYGIPTSSLAKGDDPRCFSFQHWRIKPTFVELTFMQ